jgi:hypothetical protein
MTMVDRDLLVHGIKRRVVYGVPRLWSIPAQVAATDLIAMMPRQFAAYLAPKFDLDVHEMPVKIPGQHVYMAWHIKMDGDPEHKWRREAIAATARERLGGLVSENESNVTPFVRPAGGGHTFVFAADLLAVAAAGSYTLISSSLAAASDAKAATFSERFGKWRPPA